MCTTYKYDNAQKTTGKVLLEMGSKFVLFFHCFLIDLDLYRDSEYRHI